LFKFSLSSATPSPYLLLSTFWVAHTHPRFRYSEGDFKPGDLGHSMDGKDVDVGRHTRRTLASFSMTDKVSIFSTTRDWRWDAVFRILAVVGITKVLENPLFGRGKQRALPELRELLLTCLSALFNRFALSPELLEEYVVIPPVLSPSHPSIFPFPLLPRTRHFFPSFLDALLLLQTLRRIPN